MCACIVYVAPCTCYVVSFIRFQDIAGQLEEQLELPLKEGNNIMYIYVCICTCSCVVVACTFAIVIQ